MPETSSAPKELFVQLCGDGRFASPTRRRHNDSQTAYVRADRAYDLRDAQWFACRLTDRERFLLRAVAVDDLTSQGELPGSWSGNGRVLRQLERLHLVELSMPLTEEDGYLIEALPLGDRVARIGLAACSEGDNDER